MNDANEINNERHDESAGGALTHKAAGRMFADETAGTMHADESIGREFAREAALYLDLYGGLLTARQAEILDFYYNEDYSLSEIANALAISRQAAHDALRSGTRALVEYEIKLGLVKALRDEKSNTAILLRNLTELDNAIADLRGIVADGNGSSAGFTVNESGESAAYHIADGDEKSTALRIADSGGEAADAKAYAGAAGDRAAPISSKLSEIEEIAGRIRKRMIGNNGENL